MLIRKEELFELINDIGVDNSSHETYLSCDVLLTTDVETFSNATKTGRDSPTNRRRK